MAIEPVRGCGYRKVGAIYLCADGLYSYCDRLPYELVKCEACGAGISITRGMTKIQPDKVFNNHIMCTCFGFCPMCTPPDHGYIMGVGKRYYATPEAFIREGLNMGISKRIGAVPRDFKLGITWVYLAHPEAANHINRVVADVVFDDQVRGMQYKMLEYEKAPGIFAAVRPTRLEMLIYEKDNTEETRQALEKRGITPVIVPDNDPDHKPI